jgi:regulator of nucleoside diphosphate kinase
MMMREQPIVITTADARVLRSLLSSRSAAWRDSEHLHELAVELERALVLDPDEVPHKVVTMNKAVRVQDLGTGARHQLTLVPPADADVGAQRISVLAPLGTALLGYREGDEVEWLMPGGLRRLRIEHVSEERNEIANATTAPVGVTASAH